MFCLSKKFWCWNYGKKPAGAMPKENCWFIYSGWCCPVSLKTQILLPNLMREYYWFNDALKLTLDSGAVIVRLMKSH